MSIRFGVSPIAWINDDMPELGGGTSVETVLSDASYLGFAGIELGGKFPKDPDELKPLLQRYDLDLVGGWYSASLLSRSAADEIEALQEHLSLLKAMDSTVFIQAETSNAIHGDRRTALAETPRLAPGDWPEFGRRLTEVADHVAGHGLRFAYHHHLGTVVEGAADLREFLRHTGEAVGLTVDTGHATLGGIDAVALIREAPERVAHVHCKDVRWAVFRQLEQRRGSFLEGVLAGMFTVPGDGGLDYSAVMEALAASGYSGWVIIEAEQDPEVANPRVFSALGLRTLRAEAVQAGLEIAA